MSVTEMGLAVQAEEDRGARGRGRGSRLQDISPRVGPEACPRLVVVTRREQAPAGRSGAGPIYRHWACGL